MSHNWKLRCRRCDVSIASINHGDDVWQDVVDDWPVVRQVLILAEQLVAVDVEVRFPVPLIDEAECMVWQFLKDHYDHKALEAVSSEYRDMEPVPLQRTLADVLESGKCPVCGGELEGKMFRARCPACAWSAVFAAAKDPDIFEALRAAAASMR